MTQNAISQSIDRTDLLRSRLSSTIYLLSLLRSLHSAV